MLIIIVKKIQYNINYIMSTEQSIWEMDFFSFFYGEESHKQIPFPYLKEKFKAFRHQSYGCPKAITEVNFVRRFEVICSYLSFVGSGRTQKMDILLIQQIMEQVFNDFQIFFAEGGWKAVKNKSNTCRLQQYTLLKLSKLFHKNKMYFTLDNFILSFFYTLNYFKTCNYEIKIFNEFLIGRSQLDYFFLFIILRKCSRRHQRDLIIKSQHITSIVSILKSQKITNTPGISMYVSENDELAQVKLLLIFPEIVEYIKKNEIVLHEVMIYNLMRCAGLTKEESPLSNNAINWNQFVQSYFSKICSAGKSYPQLLIQQAAEMNLKLADRIFPSSTVDLSRRTFSDDGLIEPAVSNERQSFLQESFSLLIHEIQSLINRKNENESWRRIYDQGRIIYDDHNLFVGRKLIKCLMSTQKFHRLYIKHQNANLQELQQ